MKSAILTLVVATAVGAIVGPSYAQQVPDAPGATAADALPAAGTTAQPNQGSAGSAKVGSAGSAAKLGESGRVKANTYSGEAKAEK